MKAVRTVTYKHIGPFVSEHRRDTQAGRTAAGEYLCRDKGFGTRGRKKHKENHMAKKKNKRLKVLMAGLIFCLVLNGAMAAAVFASEQDPAVEETAIEESLTGSTEEEGSNSENGNNAGAENAQGSENGSQDDQSGSGGSTGDTETTPSGSGSSDGNSSGQNSGDSGSGSSGSGSDSSGSGQNSGDSGSGSSESGSGSNTSESNAGSPATTTDVSDPENVAEGSASYVENISGGSNSVSEAVKKTNSATPITADESVVTKASESAEVKNAIQLAVDEALKAATSSTDQLTVTVEDGTYDGDITIKKGDGQTLKDDLTLYILASGSYTAAEEGKTITKETITAGAAGGAKVGGNINIDGINVVLAGLYYSLDSKINVKNSKTSVYGTEKADTIHVTLDEGGTIDNVRAGDGADDIALSGKTKTGGTVATLRGDAGDDTYTIDLIETVKEETTTTTTTSENGEGSSGNNETQTPETTPATATVQISDSDKVGTLELTGKLKDENSLTATESNPPTGKRVETTAVESEGTTTKIIAIGISNFTDSLENKKTVEISTLASTYNQELQNCTNYVFKGKVENTTLTKTDGANYYTNFIVKDDGTLTIGNLDAGNANLKLEAEKVVVNGKVKAKTVKIKASDTSDVLIDKELPIEIAGVKKIEAGSAFNFNTATVDVKKGGSITAEKVSIEAETKATIKPEKMLEKYNLNFLAFKSLTSKISIAGLIETTLGNITALAKAALTADEVDNADTAFNARIVLPDAIVEVLDGGVLKAAMDVSLKAVSTVDLFTKAGSTEKLAAAVAIGFVNNDAHVTNKGSIKAGGDVNLDAKASVKATTKAERGSKQSKDTTHGAYIAAGIIIQDASASVEGKGEIIAVGKVNLNSESVENVKTLATSEAAKSAEEGKNENKDTDAENTEKTLKNTKDAAKKGAQENGAGDDKQKKLDELGNKISSGEGKKITAKSTEGVAITADSTAKAGTTVNVTVKAKEGYKVSGATYSYYEPGSATKTTKNLDKVKDGVSGSTGYTFKMPDADVTIEATYTKKNTNDAPYEDDISDLFNDDKEDGPENLGPGRLANEGTEGAGETDTTDGNGQYTITSFTQKDNDKDVGSVFSENGKANENDTVVIKVNPASEYELKDGTLKYTYTADGTEKTETVEKTNDTYSFKMPAADVKLSAEFQKKDGSGSSSETKSSNNMYGAITFTFAGNWNLVYVDTTGVLFANKGLSLDAKANSKVLTLADASKVTEAATEASKSDTEKKEEKKNEQSGNTPGGNEGGNTEGGNSGSNEEKKSEKLNLGAAISLGVTKVVNKAYIKSGQIYATGLEIKATTGSAGTPMTSVVKAFAGNAKAATAIGGSVAVQVVTDKTSAFIAKGATVNLQTDSPLSVKAEGFDKVITVADGASAGKGEKVGIGAGLAVAVNGQDVYSGIEDGTEIKSYKKLVEADASKGVTLEDIEKAISEKIELTAPTLSAVDVTADHTGDDRLYATSGAEGKTGIAGTLVVLYSGISTKAYIGEAKAAGELLTASGDINVKANNKQTREMAADATAGASSTGIGANLLITIENDSSRAYTKRSLKAKNINVKSNSQVKTKSRSRSSAKGAKADKTKGSASEGDGSDGASDKKADQAANGASNLAGNGTSNVNSGEGKSLTAGRQKAKTSEGSVQIAAALTVNVQKNVSEAKILGGETVTTIDDLNVIAEGKMDIDVLASGAATNSTTGIGVAAAAAAATYENVASVAGKIVSAKNLTVKAGFNSAAEDATKTDLLNTMKTEAIAGAGAKNVGIAGAVAIGVVNGTDKAIVTSDNESITAAGKLVVEAIGGHKEETTASAKATKEGSADKNKETTDSAETKKESGNIGIGATFALDVVNTDTTAEVNSATAKGVSVLINAVDSDFRETTSASGTDPVTVKKEGEGQNINGTAVDATVALGVIDNVVEAKVGNNTAVYATGEAQVDSDKAVTDRKLDDNAEIADADIFVKATTISKADTKASGFATADNSAIGAAVAINIASSEANVKMNGRLYANGNVLVKAYSYDEDDSMALATAIGADMQRFLTKFQSGESDKKEENSGNNNSGNNNSGNNNSEDSQKTKPSNQNNETATNINNALNKNKKAEGENAENGKSLSQNALGTQDAKAEGTENSTVQNSQTKANDAAKNNSSQVNNEGKNNDGAKGAKLRVAAAIALNITSHKANTVVTGLISESNKNTVVEAINHSNGTTKGSAATATMADGGKDSYNISLAVGLSVNHNKSLVTVGENKEAAHVESSGNIIVKAEQTQNMDGAYKGLLTVQSVAGTSAGGSNFAMAGAVSILYAATDTEVTVGDNSFIITKTGGNVSIFSTDKSKYAVRAAGVEAGRSTKAGIGAAFDNVYADDVVRTTIGNKVTISGNDVSIYAEKAKVDWSDYKSTFEFSHYIKFTKDKEKDESALIHINYNSKSSEKKDENNSGNNNNNNSDNNKPENKTIEVHKNLKDTENILAKLDDLNFLSSTNYYLEAISGAIATSGDSAVFAVAGSIALLFENVKVETILGEEVTINAANNVRIEASSDVTARELVGGVSYDSSATATIGATVGVISTNNVIRTEVGDSDKIEAGGTYKQTSSEMNDSLMVTFAGTHADKVSVAGTIAIGDNDDDIYAGVKDNANITSKGETEIKAHLENNVLEIVATLAESDKVAVGGVINYMGSTSKTAVEAGTSAHIESTEDAVKLTAETDENLISIIAAASAAMDTAQVAAVLNVLTSDSKTYVNTGASEFKAAKDVIIKADTDSDIVTVDITAGYGKKVAVDGLLSVNVLNRKVAALVGENTTIDAGENAKILSSLKENVVMVLVAVAGSQMIGVSGLIPIIVTKNIVRTVIGNADVDDALTNDGDIKNASNAATVKAEGSIYADSTIDSDSVFVQVSFAFGKTVGVGATISTVVQQNIADTIVNNWAVLKAMAKLPAIAVNKPGTDSEGKERKDDKTGIILYANTRADVTMVSLSGAGGKTAAIGGTINTLIVNNTVRTHVRENSTLESGVELDEWADEGSYAVEERGSGNIDVEADSYSDIVDVVGGLTGAQTAAIGATVAYLGLNTKVETLTNAKYMLTNGKIDVKALIEDHPFLFNVAGSGAETAAVAGGAAVINVDNFTKAEVRQVLRADKEITIFAQATEDIINVGLSASGAETAAVAATGVVINLYDETFARIYDGADIRSGKEVNLNAITNATLDGFAIGAEGAGTAAVGGSLEVIVSGGSTKAVVGAFATIRGVNTTAEEDDRTGPVVISAIENIKALAVVVTVGGAGTAAVEISALVAVVNSTVSAVVEDHVKILSNTDVTVQADGRRSFEGFVFSIAGSGTASISANLAVVVVGAKLNDDAYKAIYQKNEDGSSGVDPVKTSSYIERNAEFKPMSGKPAAAKSTTSRQKELSATMTTDGESAMKITGADNPEGNYGSYGQNSTKASDGKSVNAEPTDEQAGKASEIIGKSTTQNAENLKNVVSAIIGAAVIDATGNINVRAVEVQSSLLISGAIAGGATAGIGASISVEILNSDVLADVTEYASLTAGKDVNVVAYSGTINPDDKKKFTYQNLNFNDSYTSENIMNKVKDKDNSASGYKNDELGIYVIGVVVGGGGTVGLSASISYVGVSTDVRALLQGTVNSAENVNVHAKYSYDSLHNILIGAAGGLAGGISATVALTFFDGNAEAGITKTAKVHNVTKEVYVHADGVAGMKPIGVAVSIGKIAAAISVAVSVNRSTVQAYVGMGALINTPEANLKVTSDVISNAKPVIAAATVGLASASITVMVGLNEAKNLAYIGRTPKVDGAEITAVDGANGRGINTITAKNVEVKANAEATSDLQSYTFAVTGIGLNGAVTVANSKVVNTAYVADTNITTGDLTITTYLNNKLTVYSLGAAVSGVNFGVQVAVGRIKSINLAHLDTTGVKVNVTNVNVKAGDADDKNRTNANVDVKIEVAVNIGGLELGVNVAYAKNDLTNIAEIIGAKTRTAEPALLASNDINVFAGANSFVKAVTAKGLEVTAGSISVSISSAYQTATQRAQVYYGTLKTKNLNVRTFYNSETNKFNKAAEASLGTPATDRGAFAEVVQGAYGDIKLADIRVSVATADFDATSLASVYGSFVDVDETTDVHTAGESYAETKIKMPPLKISLGQIGVAISNAYASGKFLAEVVMQHGQNLTTKDLFTAVFYSAKSDAQTVPAGGGLNLSVSGLDISYNQSNAKTDVTGEAAVKRGVHVTNDAKVYVNGKTSSYAGVGAYTVKISGITVSGTKVKSENYATQRAHLDTEGDVTNVDNNLTIKSVYNYLEDDNSKGATAKTGYSDGGFSVKLSLAEFTDTEATAISKVKNDAYIYERGAVVVKKDATILANSKTKAYGDVVEGYKADLLSNTVVKVTAYTQDTTKASTGDYLMLLVTGAFKMEANSNAAGNAYSVSGGALELAGKLKGFVSAGVGDYYQETPGVHIMDRAVYDAKADEDNQKVRDRYGYERADTVVGKHSYIEASKVDINVTNNATTDASLKKGFEIKIKGSSYCVVPTLVHTWSGNDIEEGAVIVVTTENANFTSIATANATSKISNSSLGASFKGDRKYPYNFVGQKAFIEFSKGSFVVAEKDINATAMASATINAESSTTIKDFFGEGHAYALNIIERNIDIDLRDQARLRTYLGNVNLKAIAGEGDNIKAYSMEHKNELSSGVGTRADNVIINHAIITTGKNAEIYAPFGQANLTAVNGDLDGENNKVLARAFSNIGSFLSGGDTYSNNYYKTDIQVIIDHTNIIASDVNLKALEGYLDLHTKTVPDSLSAFCFGLGTYADTRLEFTNRVYILNGANIRAYQNFSAVASGESGDYGHQSSILTETDNEGGSLGWTNGYASLKGGQQNQFILENSIIFARKAAINTSDFVKGDKFKQGNGGKRRKENQFDENASTEGNEWVEKSHELQLQECITDSNRKQKEYDAEMARYRKELEDAEKATPGTYTKEKIDELCVQHGLKIAEDLLKQEKAEEIQKSKDDPKYNANQYYYTEQAIVPGSEAPIESGNKSEILLVGEPPKTAIYIGSIAGVVVMTYKDKEGKTHVKSNGLEKDLTFTESGDYVTSDYPVYDDTSGTLYASERNRLDKNLKDKNNRLAQAINNVTKSFNTMSDITFLDRTGKVLRLRTPIYFFEVYDYDIQYSSWSGDSPKWKKDTDVKYLNKNEFYAVPVAGLIFEINAPGGGVSPSVTAVAENRALVSYSGEHLDVFRAYIDSSSGADAWKTEVTRYRDNKSTTPSNQAQNLGVASAGSYYAVTGNRMNEDTIREIIENVRVNNNDMPNDSGRLNQTTPNSNPPVSSQSGNNGSSTAPSNGSSGNTSGSGSGNGTKPGQDGIKGNGDSSGDVDKDDDAGQTATASAAAPNYLVFGLIAAAVAAGFFFIILLKRRKEEDEQ